MVGDLERFVNNFLEKSLFKTEMEEKRTMEERASIDCSDLSGTYTYLSRAVQQALSHKLRFATLHFSSVRYTLLSVFVTSASLPAFVVASFSFLLAAAGCAPPLPQFWLPSHAESLPALVS